VIQRILIVALLLVVPVYGGWAQANDTDEDRYSAVTAYGVTTNTNSGILGGFVFRQSKVLPNLFNGKRQFRYLSVELVNVKHPKEIQLPRDYQGSRFTLNKVNYLFVVRPQYGREVALFTRSADEGIAVNGIFAVGPSIGIIKPYFIQYQYRPGVIRNEAYDPNVHMNPDMILGAGGFFQGFEKSKFTAGLNVKAAVAFELSAFRNNMTGVEIGFLAEAFPQAVRILAQTDNRNFFTSGYVTLFFGNKR